MKILCARCRQTKPVDQFVWNRSKSRYDTYCRPCRAAYGREHYLKNKARYIENARRRTQRELARRMEFLRDFFAANPCVDCGETDMVVLEFDHLRDKSFGVSRGVRDSSWSALLDAMGKCQVVCANCHRRRSARRGNYARYALQEEQPVQRRLF